MPTASSLGLTPDSHRCHPVLVGVSAALRRIDEEARTLARSSAKVLISGETGVGKEVVARLLHHCGPRNARPFVAVNCAGVPDTLLEAELFGHVKGSFTGAYRDQAGLLEQAHGGTVLLDEIGEMSPRMQAVLLRFLDDGEVQRVGAVGTCRVTNVRVVAASHRHLPALVAANAFREDLYHRVNVAQVVVPPLRTRKDDIEPLLRFFLRTFSERYRMREPVLDREGLAVMMAYDWPGNVRQLRNAAERLVVRECRTIGPADLPENGLCRGPRTPVPRPVAPGSPVHQAAPPVYPLTPRAAPFFDRMISGRESFWITVYPAFMARDLTREDVQSVLHAGFERSRGSFGQLATLFNIDHADYKRFTSVLARHGCRVPVVRSGSPRVGPDANRAA